MGSLFSDINTVYTPIFFIDLNECATDNGGCEQICENIAGSFFCDCLEGYVVSPDGATCTDVNECTEDNGGCQQVRLKIFCSKSQYIVSCKGNICTAPCY